MMHRVCCSLYVVIVPKGFAMSDARGLVLRAWLVLFVFGAASSAWAEPAADEIEVVLHLRNYIVQDGGGRG